MMTNDLGGHCVAVVGASRGIGHAVVQRLQQGGARVLAAARTPIDGVEHHVVDVRDEAAVQRFAQAAAAAGVDAVVHNAGVGSFQPLEDTTVDEYRRIFDTNVLGLLLLCRACVPHWRARHAAGRSSRLIVVTSDVSSRSFAGGALYAGSKHAQRAVLQAMAHEGQAYGLALTELRPGMTDTHFNGRTPGEPARALHLRPADVADAVAQVLAAPAHVRIDEITLHPVVQPVVY